MVSVARQTLLDNGSYIGCAAEDTADPNWNSCVFLLSGQGANGSTPATDTTGKALTWGGTAAISTSQSKFYGSSASFGPGAGYASTPNASVFQTISDFTIRCWVYVSSLPSSPGAVIFGRLTNAASYFSVGMYLETSGNAALYASSTNSSYDIANGVSLGSLSTPGWHHIEAGRLGSAGFCFRDGVLTGTFTSSNLTYAGTAPVMVGGAVDGMYLSGFVSDAELYNGACLHTSSFIPPTRDALCSARRYPGGVYGL